MEHRLGWTNRDVQDEIDNINKRLYDVEGRCLKLEKTLGQSSDKLQKKKKEANDRSVLEDLEKKIRGMFKAKEDLQKEKEEIEVAIKEGDDQIATLEQRLHQTENRAKIFKEETDNKVTLLKELQKDKQPCKANLHANYKYNLQQVEDTQSALEATKLQCGALEEEMKRKIVERDEHHLQELSERKGVLGKKLSEQEQRFKEEMTRQKERFELQLADREATLKQQLSEREEAHRKDLSEQEERSKEKLAHLEDNLKRQLSEAEESYRKVIREHEERLKKKLGD